MKVFRLLLIFQIGILKFVSAQRLDTYPVPHPDGYVCYKTEQKITVDGSLDELAWNKALWTKDFVDIEGDKKPVPFFRTRTKMLWDNEFLYVAAELEEPHIWGTIKEPDAVIFHDNDFEVFIDPDGDNHLYYEFEINALNTVWDLLIVKPYKDGGPTINNWDINGLSSGVKVYGTLNNPGDKDDKWTVEIAFPWGVLEETAKHRGHPFDGEQWRVSFSRVEWRVDIVDNQYKKKTDENGKILPELNWTWPQQDIVNMHRPETWGYVQFSESFVGSELIDFKEDSFFNLKMALMEVYYQQRVFFRKNGIYTNNVGELGLSEFNKKNFTRDIYIETMSDRFTASIKKDSVVWSVDEKSRLVSRKMKKYEKP